MLVSFYCDFDHILKILVHQKYTFSASLQHVLSRTLGKSVMWSKMAYIYHIWSQMVKSCFFEFVSQTALGTLMRFDMPFLYVIIYNSLLAIFISFFALKLWYLKSKFFNKIRTLILNEFLLKLRIKFRKTLVHFLYL